MTKIPEIPYVALNNQQTPQAVGERFRLARELCPLSRTAFCTKHHLNWYTVQAWELGRTVSRSLNTAKFCEALALEGVICTEDWLIEGIGVEPYLASTSKSNIYVSPITARQLKKESAKPHEDLVQKEVALFYENNQKMNGIVIQVSDEAMDPDYEVGEFIGAIRVPPDQIKNLHQLVCLVEAAPHHFLIRRLLREGDAYILLATNTNFPLIRLDQITSVGEIVWRRRVPRFAENKNHILQE